MVYIVDISIFMRGDSDELHLYARIYNSKICKRKFL